MGGKRFIRISGIQVAPDEPAGEKFGRLIRIGRRFKIKSRTYVVAECECGCVLVANDSRVDSKRTQSCGCLHRDVMVKSLVTHGMSGSVEFAAWCRMNRRCTDESYDHYADYGGRGITVCDRWLNSFENFFADMGPRPSPQHSVDRIKNNENYYPENCRWSTRAEQCNNRRSNVRLTIDGFTRTIAEWAKRSPVPSSTIYYRVTSGWPHADAVFKPVRKKATAVESS